MGVGKLCPRAAVSCEHCPWQWRACVHPEEASLSWALAPKTSPAARLPRLSGVLVMALRSTRCMGFAGPQCIGAGLCWESLWSPSPKDRRGS